LQQAAINQRFSHAFFLYDRYAFGATIGPTLAGIGNQLGGLAAYVWLQLCIGELWLFISLLVV
jgi:hypothetical protein